MTPRTRCLALLLASAPSSLGCAPLTIVQGNAVTFFHAPAKVPHKITEPYRPDARLAVLWIGHATVLLQLDDKLVLTDPVFTDTIGQVSRRLVEPGLDPASLPPVDAGLISHLHSDHLSTASLDRIQHKLALLVVPEQGTAHVPDFSFETVELPAWRSFERDGLRITAVPVRHTGFRWGPDGFWMRGKGFTGYVVEYHGLTVYFGGDTAYEKQLFVETRARFPRIDLAILPIAPGRPRSLMEPMHTDPLEALRILDDLGARWMLPVHFGTFINSIEPPDAEVNELRELTRARGLEERVQILSIGEQRVLVRR